MLYGLVAFVALLATIAFFYLYFGSASLLYFILAIICLIATVGFGGIFLSGRVNKKEDVHITE